MKMRVAAGAAKVDIKETGNRITASLASTLSEDHVYTCCFALFLRFFVGIGRLSLSELRGPPRIESVINRVYVQCTPPTAMQYTQDACIHVQY